MNNEKRYNELQAMSEEFEADLLRELMEWKLWCEFFTPCSLEEFKALPELGGEIMKTPNKSIQVTQA